jgi:hypothetical protein
MTEAAGLGLDYQDLRNGLIVEYGPSDGAAIYVGIIVGAMLALEFNAEEQDPNGFVGEEVKPNEDAELFKTREAGIEEQVEP